jgi:hypothetical protein
VIVEVGNDCLNLIVLVQYRSNEATDRSSWNLLLRIGSDDVVRLSGNKSIGVV